MEADRLNQIASEMLDYSRGEIRLNMSIVDIRAFFNRFLEAVEEKMQARDITVATEVAISQPVIMDEQRMFRVFYNLADNARKAMQDLRNGGKKAEKISEKHVQARRAQSMPQGPKKHSVHTLRGR